MASRGIHQLKNIRLYFCDFGGSSVGLREAMKSQEFADHVKANPNVKVEIYMRRNHHPYMSTTFINGYVKDIPLRNNTHEESLGYIQSVYTEFGRKALRHNQARVITTKKSIQGGW